MSGLDTGPSSLLVPPSPPPHRKSRVRSYSGPFRSQLFPDIGVPAAVHGHAISMRLVPSTTNAMGLHMLRQLHLSRAKLKASSKTSALLSGFAMVAMVEVQLMKRCKENCDGDCADNCSNIPDGLLVAFSVCTTLLVAVHLLALMISTCILPHVEAVASLAHVDSVTNLHSGNPGIYESPHVTMRWYIEAAWTFSTVLGILLFLVEIGILSWVKFHDYSPNASIVSTVLLVPIVLVFTGFAFHFYYKLVAHKVESAGKNLQEIEEQLRQLQQRTNENQPNGANSSIHVV
ncbi:calcium release-activated calcium channel protein 1-like isoform X1 [Penaeus japonicus]|uniref:calcium release-activated calcium channel protein 1-like isoform X1 n=2 Tax=Penaeus japonicus TaxID=27405 RepID=UPI001C70BE05|nr:calcium release-activated calcium channel protein 1-like isoform X1 [Penaeus japonicus]